MGRAPAARPCRVSTSLVKSAIPLRPICIDTPQAPHVILPPSPSQALVTWKAHFRPTLTSREKPTISTLERNHPILKTPMGQTFVEFSAPISWLGRFLCLSADLQLIEMGL